MPTLDEIETAVDEAMGRAVLDQIASPDPHAHDRPIRHHETGQIVAWIPEASAVGLVPVIRRGLVVGYYKDTPRGRYAPAFCVGLVLWVPIDGDEESMCVFHEDGSYRGNVTLRRRRRPPPA